MRHHYTFDVPTFTLKHSKKKKRWGPNRHNRLQSDGVLEGRQRLRPFTSRVQATLHKPTPCTYVHRYRWFTPKAAGQLQQNCWPHPHCCSPFRCPPFLLHVAAVVGVDAAAASVQPVFAVDIPDAVSAI